MGDLLQLLTVIIHNSTIMPFRWYSNKFLCFYCCCPFEDSCSLKEHTKSEHDEPKIKLKILLTMLRKTRVKLDVSEVTCKTCHKTLHTLEEYVSHASSEHNLKCNKNVCKDLFSFKLTDSDISCLECGQTFKFFGTLVKHAHKYHNKSHAFQCDICNEKFISKHNLNSHIKNVHGQTECEKCQKVFPTHYAYKCHIEKSHGRLLKCPKCPEILTSRYHKQRHLANVHNDKSSQNKCDICFKDFAWKSLMLRHRNDVHFKEKSIACDVCGFRTSNTELLKKHMVCHDDSRPYKCEFCPKTFRRKKGQDLHTRIHTNDKRYVCKECGKAFVQGTSLKLHVRVHHSGNKQT